MPSGPKVPRAVVNDAGNEAPEPSEQEKALATRMAWMKLMGMSDQEILENCGPEFRPFNLEDELAELKAVAEAEKFELTNDEMSAIAARCPPPPEWFE
jgi:hypothetical protein